MQISPGLTGPDKAEVLIQQINGGSGDGPADGNGTGFREDFPNIQTGSDDAGLSGTVGIEKMFRWALSQDGGHGARIRRFPTEGHIV